MTRALAAPGWLPADICQRATLYPSRLHWLADRLESKHTQYGVGSTTVAAILGVSNFADPWSIWTSHHAQERADYDNYSVADWMRMAEESEASKGRNAADLDRGNHFEDPIRTAPAVASRYTEQWGGLCRVHHPRYPWFAVSPDGFALTDSGVGAQEVKTARYGDGWSKDGTVIFQGPRRGDSSALHLAPPYYLTQAYALLECTGLPWVDLTVGLAFHDVRTIRIMADKAYQSWMLRTVAAWRERHLIRGAMPEIDGSKSCGKYLRTLDADPDDEVEADHIAASVLDEYAQVKTKADDLKKRMEIIRNRVRAGMAVGGARKVYAKGIATASINSRGTLTNKPKSGRTTCVPKSHSDDLPAPQRSTADASPRWPTRC